MKKAVILELLFLLFFSSLLYGRNPVLFVHGFTGSANSFRTIANHLIEKRGWSYGGELTFNPLTNQVESANAASFGLPELRDGDFYLMDFSDYRDPFPSQNLTLRQQAEELQKIVTKVLELTQKPQIVLVGHSMGGLAIRAYLQWLQATNVEQAIFVDNPHAGSETAMLADQKIWQILARLFKKEINPSSVAVQLLKPGSSDLQLLNNFMLFPFPKNTKLASVITEGGNIPVIPPNNGVENDGFISVASQDLSQVPGAEQATPQEILRFVYEIKSDIDTRQWAHFVILHRPPVANTLVQIIDQNFPRAKVDNYYLAGGDGYVIRLDHAPFSATVEALVWQNNKRVYDLYQPVQISNDAGQRTFMGTTPVDTANFSVQFRLGEWISNCVRVTTQKNYFPALELIYSYTGFTQHSVIARITRAKPQSPVKIIGLLSSGVRVEFPSFSRTNDKGEWFGGLGIDRNETRIVAQAVVDTDLSNPVVLNLGFRSIFNLQGGPFAQDFSVTGMKLIVLPDYRYAFEELFPTATFEFRNKVVLFLGQIKTAVALTILVMPWNGPEYQFGQIPAGNTWQTLRIREAAGIFRITIKASGTTVPSWTLTDLMTTADDRPPLIVTGFDRDPIPKGEKYGGGWWRNWIFLQQPDDMVPIQIEKLEFDFKDKDGNQYMTQTVSVEEMKKDGWFGLNPWALTPPPPFDFCGRLVEKLDGSLWLMGRWRICQELVYAFTLSPIEPRFVQMRFFVKDLFLNRQTITYNAVMLPQ